MTSRFTELAARSQIAAMVLSNPAGEPSFLYLHEALPTVDIELKALYRRGFKTYAGVVGLTRNGVDFEAEEGLEPVMVRAASDFTLAVSPKNLGSA
jgi:hypothetical protein